MLIRSLPFAMLLGFGAVQGGCDAAPEPSRQTVVTTAEAAATHSVALGEQVITARVIPTRQLDASVTRRYGIDRDADRALLLITVRSASGDAIAADGLQLTAQAGELHAAPTAVALRTLQVDGFTDVVGTLQAKPPATLRIVIQAERGGARAQLTFTHDWLP